jgi:hypothetical protein
LKLSVISPIINPRVKTVKLGSMKAWYRFTVLMFGLIFLPVVASVSCSSENIAATSMRSVGECPAVYSGSIPPVVPLTSLFASEDFSARGAPSVDEISGQLAVTPFTSIELLLGTSNDTHRILLASTSASLFRDPLQTQPVYGIKLEYSPPDPSKCQFIDKQFSPEPLPWFMQTASSFGGRLCGWKDSNLLYAAAITYY